ncbi:SIR2 family protein [Lysobacter hankyongensis]|uniref:SIR2-like domain-containing protein n=1 Tax=Lysobacter hankyongensis TaxID=1176535 RepID=A0ABP9B638_9GAMM
MTTGSTGGDDTTASRHLYSIEYDADDGTLTPLQGQPIIDLYRSLAIGGIVAFVGSGTSYLLGYESWDALAENILKVAYGGDEEGRSVSRSIAASNKPAHRSSDEDASSSKLDVALKKVRDKQTPAEGPGKLDKYDRLALATEKIRQAQAYRGVEDDGKAKQFYEGKLREKYRESFEFRLPRTRAEADGILKKMGRSALFARDAKALQGALGKSKFMPVDYSGGLQLIATLAKMKNNESRASSKKPLKEKELLQSPHPSIDVLGVLRRNWKISRYATLNYDHEIERMLERADFPFYSITPDSEKNRDRREDPADQDSAGDPVMTARSRLGEKARSVDLDRRNVAEFMLFSAGSPAGVSQVLHLHGSVRDPGNMIVTDIDYNRRYFANNIWTDLLEDSQELLYRGNAIVFVGVGMTEDVLFRAMRILSQAPDRDMRPVYAFMQTNGQAKDTADAIKLFQRYGIRTIFYGTRLIAKDEPEAGGFNNHPLVKDAMAAIGIGNSLSLQEVAQKLNPLSVELEFLEELRNSLGNYIRGIEEHASSKKMRAGRPIPNNREFSQFFEMLCVKLNAICAVDSSGGGSADSGTKKKSHTAKKKFDPTSGDFQVERLPRILLTPWHNTIFKIVWRVLSDRSLENFRRDMVVLEALREVIGSLYSAVHSRALRDALQAISAESIEWRKRWKATPGSEYGAIEGRHHFRHPDQARIRGGVCGHNVSLPHREEDSNREILKAILADESGESARHGAASALRRGKIVVARSRNGAGKGILATRLANEQDLLPGTRRLVVSFGQSCGRDPVYDLIVSQLDSVTSSDQGGCLEVVISKADIILTASERRPKLAEWEAVISKLVTHERTKVLLLCEGNEARDYFRHLAQNERLEELWPEPPVIFQEDSENDEPHVVAIKRISKHCKSVWLASFLSAVYAEIVIEESDQVPLVVKKSSFDEILRRIEHAMDVTQDPRQRVPAVINVAMANIEHYVVSHRGYEDRIVKVISHAILKHLFAFGGPVERAVFSVCPSLVEIKKQYGISSRNFDRRIHESISWLRKLDMITELSQCYRRVPDDGGDEVLRYGLHGHVRNWLSTKKGLPFSVVVGREQTAITVVPIIDEEVVPLDREDYQFIWDTVDGLLHLKRPDSAPPEQIRAAFMLLRGSMRVGTVLRSPHGDEPKHPAMRTPLEEYLCRLLLIRHAALESASSRSSEIPPLFEREWVWLFNEMGVVKLLQGHIHDATALFEQAIEFETLRLKRRDGFEAFIYADTPYPEFSITKLRIMMNLALAEIEHGAFDRARRILSSEKRDLERLSALFLAKGRGPVQGVGLSQPGDDRKLLHREIRILLLVQGLIDARLKFLSGGTGEAMQWLDDTGRDIVGEGVHGLTSLYYLVRADIDKRRGNHDMAAQCFALARTEAEASGRSDLVFSVLLGEAECHMARRQARGAPGLQQQLTKIRKIKHEARRMGMSRVAVTASMIRARLYLSFGEYRSARQDLMTALTLSTANGLNIKRVSALIDMAALIGSLDAELRDEAKDIAEAARFEAERMGYKLAAARAKDLELVLREQGSIEEWVLRQDREASGMQGDAD